MATAYVEAETLRSILEDIHTPELLDEHPWVSCSFVKDVLERNPHLRRERPGVQLSAALTEQFYRMMPSTPPRRGKRLDNHWGEFGLLAARYFAPVRFGTPVPNSLRDAWGRIDTAILYSVYGKPADALTQEQVRLYEVVGDDLEYACASTLSDWNKKGVQRFTEFVLDKERYLEREAQRSSAPTVSEQAPPAPRHWKTKRWLWMATGLLLILAIAWASLKASRIYASGNQVYQDLQQVQALAHAPLEIKTIEAALPALTRLQADLSAFEVEAAPVMWLGPKLSWLPTYGPDLAAAPKLVDLGEHLLNAGILAARAAQPMLSELDSDASNLDTARLTKLLVQAQPVLKNARAELDHALALRKSLNPDRLSPRLRGLLLDELDPRLKLADESLSLAMAVPGALGAGVQGPQTYLLLVENEDELRPTGGFITSVGNLVVHNGSIINLSFEDSGEQEDWSYPYPTAPWQLQEYMNSNVLILRDANWFSDFPTAALWAEYLYAYTHDHSVDGVIAFDQQLLVMLLEQLGPLEVEGVPYPIDAGNVMEYMRQAKEPPATETLPADWTRKAFIGKLADAVLNRLTDGDHGWKGLTRLAFQALAERHLLLQFDDPVLAALVAERGWDNAVRPAGGDYLMVTDTNIGFNKTNAVVEVSLTYDVDLSDLDAPQSTLSLIHHNNAIQNVPCIQWDTSEVRKEETYPIDRCYWNYLRVYKQADVKLLAATPHAIPGDWMILGENVPARVDELEEEIPGVQGFGTLLVVPGSSILNTSFQFALPPTALLRPSASGEYVYHLKVQKQPGTIEHPLVIRIHFPNRAILKDLPPGAVLQDADLLLKTHLRTDVELEVSFTVP